MHLVRNAKALPYGRAFLWLCTGDALVATLGYQEVVCLALASSVQTSPRFKRGDIRVQAKQGGWPALQGPAMVQLRSTSALAARTLTVSDVSAAISSRRS